jgi:sugar phosphate permease
MEKTKHSFAYWQWRTIFGTMIGYAVFYFVRKNLSFAIPGLTAEYGISKAALGAILAIVSIVYGVSKLINGFLADRTNGRWHMVAGLSVCTIVNVLFGFGAMICAYFVGSDYGPVFTNALIVLFGILLVVNNIFQGCGFPPCNRLMTHWVPPHELSTKMSIWNTSHSIGAFVAAVLCGFIMGHFGTDQTGNAVLRERIVENTQSVTASMDPVAAQNYVDGMLQHYGAWQWAFWIPAAIAALGVIFIIIVLRDTPKSVGLPELPGTVKTGKSKEESKAHRKFILEHVIKSKLVWILALADFFVYVVRMAVLDWGPTFLQENRGLTPTAAASVVAIFEVFGIIGMLSAGVITDKLFKGRGQRTSVFCMLGVVLFIAAFCFFPVETDPLLLCGFLICAGFFLYGPQALIGVIASNQVTRRGASSAVGIIGFVSYIAPIVSGYVFGILADTPSVGWDGVFKIMIVVAIAGALTMASLWNVKADAYETEAAVADTDKLDDDSLDN